MIDITNIQIPKNGEKLMMDIYEHIGKIDEDMTKWRQLRCATGPARETF